MIDPNTLLGNIRNAIALGHPAVAQMSFATLDSQLSNGGQLPDEWEADRAAGKQVVGVYGYRDDGVHDDPPCSGISRP